MNIRVSPESVFALLRRRKDRGVDPDLDHAELFTRGGIVLRGPSIKPVVLMYSIHHTAFFARGDRRDITYCQLTEEVHHCA